MSNAIVPASSEPIARPRARKLPDDAEIDHFEMATPGWVVYYHQAEISRVIGLPVTVWALVSYDSYDEGKITRKRAIRHFVVTESGALVDYMDIPNDFLCIIGPMIPDHKGVILQHLAERGLEIEGDVKPFGN